MRDDLTEEQFWDAVNSNVKPTAFVQAITKLSVCFTILYFILVLLANNNNNRNYKMVSILHSMQHISEHFSSFSFFPYCKESAETTFIYVI